MSVEDSKPPGTGPSRMPATTRTPRRSPAIADGPRSGPPHPQQPPWSARREWCTCPENRTGTADASCLYFWYEAGWEADWLDSHRDAVSSRGETCHLGNRRRAPNTPRTGHRSLAAGTLGSWEGWPLGDHSHRRVPGTKPGHQGVRNTPRSCGRPPSGTPTCMRRTMCTQQWSKGT